MSKIMISRISEFTTAGRIMLVMTTVLLIVFVQRFGCDTNKFDNHLAVVMIYLRRLFRDAGWI